MSKDLVALLRRPYGNLTFAEKQQVADLIEGLETKLAKAVALLGQWRLASAGHVSVRSVIDKHDATIAELKGQD